MFNNLRKHRICLSIDGRIRCFFVLKREVFMMLSLACITSEVEYATRMISYMKSNPIYRTWKVQLFTSYHKFLLSSLNDVPDVVLVDESIEEQVTGEQVLPIGEVRTKISPLSSSVVIALVTQNKETGHLHQLQKYVPLSKLLHDIQNIVDHNRVTPARIQQEGVTVVSVGSSLPYCGKTIFALHLAHILASRQYKVFYMNLEVWNTSMQWISSDDRFEGSYSEYLYVLKSNSQDINQWLKANLHYDSQLQFEYLKPFLHREDRANLTQLDVESMLGAIVQLKQYDYIIVDLDAGYHQWNQSTVSKSHVHFMMMLSSEQWLAKHEKYMQFLQQISENEYEGLEQQAIKVSVGDIANAGIQKNTKVHIKLPFIESWQSRIQPILSSPSYRAVVEHCIQNHLLMKEYV